MRQDARLASLLTRTRAHARGMKISINNTRMRMFRMSYHARARGEMAVDNFSPPLLITFLIPWGHAPGGRVDDAGIVENFAIDRESGYLIIFE